MKGPSDDRSPEFGGESLIQVQLTTSNRPRPSVQKTGKGHQWWRREVHHVLVGDRTACGRDAFEWLRMDARDRATALLDDNLCVRCAAAVIKST